MITMLFCLTFGTVCAQAATTATTTTAKAAVKNGWKKEGGQYYYYIKGKKVTNKLKKINGAIYYLGSNGARKTGWYTVKSGNTYKTMQFASNGKYTGKSKKANAELIKMTDSVLRSQKISASLTTTAQKKTALQKLFNYSKKYGYMRMKGFDGKPLQFTKGKSQMFAYLTMGMEKGNATVLHQPLQYRLNVQQDFRSVYAGEKVMYLIKINGSHMDGQRQDWKYLYTFDAKQQETNPEKMLNIICRNLHP